MDQNKLEHFIVAHREGYYKVFQPQIGSEHLIIVDLYGRVVNYEVFDSRYAQALS
jgi:hypothetical protein